MPDDHVGEQEERVIFCLRVADTPPSQPLVPDSVIRRCCQCGEKVYVSHAAMIASPGAQLLCEWCFRRVARGETVRFEEFAEAQIRQMARALGERPTGEELRDARKRAQDELLL